MKNIRSNYIKESLLDYENLTNSLKENTSKAVKNLLDEAVRDTFNQLITEEDEDEYEVSETDDNTNADDSQDTEDNSEEVSDEEESNDSQEDETEVDNDEAESEEESETLDDEDLDTDDTTDDSELLDNNMETTPEEETSEPQDNNNEWAEFDKYKISDDEYDFSQANDEDIVKVYKLLKDDDQVLVNVNQNDNKVELKDNQTGAEYLLDLGSFNKTNNMPNNDNEMNESRLFELVLNEENSNLGYTDNYQKKDVMTQKSNKEPGKKVNDWDAGVPKGTSKPWAGKGKSEPFNEETEEEIPMEEGTNVGGFVQQNSTSKSHIPNSSGRKARNARFGTQEPRYTKIAANENKAMVNKVNQILKENNELKKVLAKFKNVLQEAAVTNLNLGQIIKLISENSTSKNEKQEIIMRFGKEAKTVEQSKQLYETISRELKKNNVNNININEDKQFTTNGSQKINETPIYQSPDLLSSLDLMHRLCK